MFGLFGKKQKNAPQPVEQTNSGFVNDPNYDRVCQLVGYKPLGQVAEVGYYFITKNYCCAVDSEGIIYGGLDVQAQQPYRDRFVMRPNEVDRIESEPLQINDNGVDMVSIKLFYVGSDRSCSIFIPVVDVDRFTSALGTAIASDEEWRNFMGDDYGYGSFI